ncbi:autotransporter-associated beta strand repeat-containing protein [Rahnella sp. AA]|uniref:autotransporter-associated beta strand repeat-containing protein n=1 Tax=Rahnella sp. AA TaxID=2057180 RepID=UPI0018E30152|nr:autotransporter-associated beta strand repeat-containing protein [Rahnella sp. AA]
MHITNLGDISSAGTHGTSAIGTIEFGAGASGVVDNYNTINGGRSGQVGSNVNGIVTAAKNQIIINNHNGASIASGSAEAAIKILGGSTQIVINNDGEITGFLQGIVQTDGAIQIKNSNTGHITSVSQAAVELNNDSTLENHGNISGNQAEAILLDGKNNHITLGTGSTLSGANNNVILSKSTGNTLTLTSDDANASVENGNITSDTAEHGLSQLTSATNSHWVLGGDVRLAGTTTDTLNVQGDLTLTGSLTQNGIGGGTTIAQGGTLALNDGGQMNGAIIDNGTLIFNKNEDFVFTDIISGSGSLIQSGTLTLTADNTYTGLTTINHGGILTLGNGTDTGNVAGDITNSGTLNINHNNSVALNGTLSGAGNLNQIGTGTTTLTAQNSVQGAVSVNAGTLDFAQEGNFTASALNVASAATLKLEDKAKLAVSGAARLDGEVDLNIINGGPLITADSITLGADSILNLTGASGTIPEMASQIAQNRTTVLQTNQGITGDFASVEFGYQTHLDYILFDGTKSADGKSYSVGEELAWTSAAPEAGGTFTLANAGDHFNVDVVLSDENANITTGWDGKSLTKSGDGTLTLSAANTYSGGTTVNAGSVILAQDKAAGTGAVTVNNAGNLDLTFNDGTFSNNVAGAGKVTVSGTGIELAGDATGFTGMWDVTGGAGATQQSQLGDAQVLLDGTQSQLTLNNFSDAFASQLTGDGILQINQTSSTTPFSFASTTGSGFTGTVKVQQGTLTLDSNAEQTLTNSTLALTPAGTAAIDADRSIHSLIMGGGTLQMDNSRTVAHTLTTETFDASAGGRIQANIPEALSPPVIPTNPSYFDQDAIRNVQIVKATGQVTGIGNHIDLYNFDGSKPVGQSTDVSIIDGGVNLGTATYDQALVVTEDGAWVGYDLIKLDANAGQTLTLENQPGMDNMLVAQLTGAGNFDIQGSGTVILNNLTNDYTGNTQVSAGNVQLGSDNALGHTNDVIIASGAGLDINGKSQNITTLHSAAGSSLNLNGGNLTVAQGGESLGTLAGSGQLNLSGGELAINGENQNLSASIQIAQPATATMKNILGLGDGAINVDGNLNLSGANGTMSNMLSGNGTVALEEGAQVTLNNTVRTFAGDFTVATGTQLTAQEAGSLGTATVTNSGTLELNNNADWTLTNGVNGSGGVNKTGTGTLFADSNMTYTGDTHITEGALQVNGNFGSTGTMYVEQAGALKGHGSIAGSVINNGIIDLTSATQNNALTINGDYNSNNGQLWVNSELNGDGSAHDELFVKGNTSGNTAVTVKICMG